MFTVGIIADGILAPHNDACALPEMFAVERPRIVRDRMYQMPVASTR